MRVPNFRLLGSILAAGALVVTSACGSSSGSDTSSGGTDLGSVKSIVSTRSTFEFVAAELGLKIGAWKDLGLKVENVFVSGAGQVAQALTAGQADIAMTAAASTINAIAKAAPLKLIAAIGDQDYKTMVVVVPKNSPIKTDADLKGKTIGVTSPGSGTDYLAQSIQTQNGWSNSDLKRAAIGGLDEQLAALKSGSTDAFIWSIEAAKALEANGEGRILRNFGDLTNEVFEVFVATDKAISSKKAQLEAYLKGWYTTVKYMQSHRNETVDFVASDFEVSKELAGEIYDFAMPILSRDGSISDEVLKGTAESLVKQGKAKTAPATETWWHEGFVPVKISS